MLRLLTTGALSAALALTALAAPADAQSRLPASLSLPTHDHERCGLAELSQSEADAASVLLNQHRALHGSTVERFGGFPTITIPIAYHIVLGTGVAAPSEATVIAQNEHMNEAYAGTGFRFVIAHIGYTVNDDWYGEVAPGTGGVANNPAALAMKRALSIDPARTLNVFFTEFSAERSTLLGYGAFPTSWAEGQPEWSIINRIGTLPGGNANQYNSGDTMVHEVGHNINLYHTFQGGCHPESQCLTAGDRVCDTPAQASQPSSGCPALGVDTCPTSAGLDDNENYMNYLWDSCAEAFTPGQAERAHASMATFRPTIYTTSLGLTTVTGSVDFDETYIGFAETQTIYVFNSSDEATTVTGVSVPDGFSVDIAAPFTLQPGASVPVAITFDPQTETVFASSVVFTTAGGAADLTVEVDGFGRLAPDVAAAPRPVVLQLQPGASAQASFELLNQGPGTLDWTADGFAARIAARGGDDGRAGGPDAFGYTWVDSRSPYGPTAAFADIAGAPGTSTVPLGDDDAFETFLPFAFPFYGQTYALASIVSNGRIAFGDDVSTVGTNTPIPRPSEPNGFLAPFWEALDLSTGTVYYQATAERAIVQWTGVARAADPSARLTFQAVLYPDGRVLFQYGPLAGLAQREVIGIENLDGTDGLQVSARAAFLEPGLAVLIAPPVQLVQGLTPAGGTVGPDGARTLTVTAAVPATALPGTYVERVFIRSNDPDERVLDVPVVVQVNPAGAPGIPEPVSPEYAAEGLSSPVSLSWTATGAGAYDVEVATDERFAEVVFRAPDVAGTSAVASGLGIGTYYWHVRSDAGSGVVSTWSAPYVFSVGAVSSEEPAGQTGATATALLSTFPNPFTSSATVRFALAESADVALVAYDVLGKEVARLAEGPYGAGEHEATFRADGLAPGVYLVRFAAGGVMQTRQVVVAR